MRSDLRLEKNFVKSFCYIILFVGLSTLTSCAQTQLTIDDSLVLKGSWIGIMIEGEKTATLEFDLNANQDCSKSVTQTCDRYDIFGSVIINKKSYTIKDGNGSLGFVSSASEFSYVPYFDIAIYDGKTQLGLINGNQKSDFYEISFTSRSSDISQIPKNGILKKVTRVAN
jgi:hypothetical protein